IEGAAEKGIQSIGVDQDQSALAPQNVLCSVEKKVDVPIFDQIKLVLKDKFKGGEINYDLENGGLAIADKEGNLSKETNDSIKKWTKAIVKDKFVVPANSETFQSFVVPEV
ncbi:MAG: BMP family ABC transporter substrate-binding protein, partial [Anaerovoracaceae bacterium]